MHLERPAGGERDERGPVLAAQNDACGCLLGGEDLREHVDPDLRQRLEQAGGAGCDIGVRVDLAMRMMQRDADRFAPILKRKHLLHAGKRRQRRRAIGPGFNHRAGARRG